MTGRFGYGTQFETFIHQEPFETRAIKIAGKSEEDFWAQIFYCENNGLDDLAETILETYENKYFRR